MVEIRASLPAESAHPDVRHGTCVGLLHLFVELVQPAPVVEYLTPAPAVTHAQWSRVHMPLPLSSRDSSTYCCLCDYSDHCDSGANSPPNATVPFATAPIAVDTVWSRRFTARFPRSLSHVMTLNFGPEVYLLPKELRRGGVSALEVLRNWKTSVIVVFPHNMALTQCAVLSSWKTFVLTCSLVNHMLAHLEGNQGLQRTLWPCRVGD